MSSLTKKQQKKTTTTKEMPDIMDYLIMQPIQLFSNDQIKGGK